MLTRTLPKPPALTTGLALLLLAAHAVPGLPRRLQLGLELTAGDVSGGLLNQLSFFQFAHASLGALLPDLALLLPLLGLFELYNGTVRAGVVLNVASVLPALVYTIVGVLGLPLGLCRDGRCEAYGMTTWSVVLAAATAWRLFALNVTFTPAGGAVRVPPWLVAWPVLVLTVPWPGASLITSGVGLALGNLIGLGRAEPLVAPPGRVAEWIEARIQPVIRGLSHIVTWVEEKDAKLLRAEPLVEEALPV